MPGRDKTVLTVNGGSSSIKFALFSLEDTTPRRAGRAEPCQDVEGVEMGGRSRRRRVGAAAAGGRGDRPLSRLLEGLIERIGLPQATLHVKVHPPGAGFSRDVAASDHAGAVDSMLDAIQETGGGRREGRDGLASLAAVGHRIVHGGARYYEPQRITDDMLEELRELIPIDPEHLAGEIRLAEVLSRRIPGIPQIACFDTAFHHDLPVVSRTLAIPRKYSVQGVRRYGFHGLSYAFLMEELARLGDPAAMRGRVILGHLGNGASLAAVLDGKPIDTTMGFTPAAGLPMSTRTGDMDPGLVSYLMRTERMTVEEFNDMVNFKSGLLGISETSSDVRDLLSLEQRRDERAAEAIAFFCYQVKKWIGAYAAALGGLDTLVFSGGIGENSSTVRARICEGLDFLGIRLDDRRNSANEAVISASSPNGVSVRVIRTDEEIMLARIVYRLLDPS
jgi:acetate kinase